MRVFMRQANFPAHIWIFTEGEGDGIKSRLPLNIFSTLNPPCNTGRGFYLYTDDIKKTYYRFSFWRNSQFFILENNIPTYFLIRDYTAAPKFRNHVNIERCSDDYK